MKKFAGLCLCLMLGILVTAVAWADSSIEGVVEPLSPNALPTFGIYAVTITGDVSGTGFARSGVVGVYPTVTAVTTNGINPIDIGIVSGNPPGLPEPGALWFVTNDSLLGANSLIDYAYVSLDEATGTVTAAPDAALFAATPNTFTRFSGVTAYIYSLYDGAMALQFTNNEVIGAIDLWGRQQFTQATAHYNASVVGELIEGYIVPDVTSVARSNDGTIILEFPSGAVDTWAMITIDQTASIDHPGGSFIFAGKAFAVEVFDASTNSPIHSFNQPFQLTVKYQDTDWQNAGIEDESSLNIAWWNGGQWQPLLPCAGCSLDTANNEIVVMLDHLTEFGLFGVEIETAYLPLITKP
ncbi:MAG: hypothetical protein H6658_00215 [Ardenticatenaceae bacterium]|nr:hypothetical protein [Ardenticatenaceae bacterium]